MDYEKAYKKALARARDYYKANLKLDKADENLVLEDIFPELKESEDEKIRKALIRFFQRFPYDRLNYENLKSEEAITWLEKQGNQREQLINKACEWLEEKLPIYWSQVNANDTEEFIDEFKKAMGE